MKYNNSHFMQVSRKLFEYSFEELPHYSRYIFFVMNELEHKYTGDRGQQYFYRSNKELALDCGLSVKTIQRYKKYLIDLKLIKHWKMHFFDEETKKYSEHRVSAYQILI